ncbi:hypothetical protein B0T19DRAFT_446594 [Cercophora scortea]|uniref:Uncharacterized protein n=1 Tax=Cercophora scortea TaxID=314031 RepID=A0AAE0I3K8_9PEZI|nr:hypothetical protein B0T19DRAFT_446594 [Cercophora scortea]
MDSSSLEAFDAMEFDLFDRSDIEQLERMGRSMMSPGDSLPHTSSAGGNTAPETEATARSRSPRPQASALENHPEFICDPVPPYTPRQEEPPPPPYDGQQSVVADNSQLTIPEPQVIPETSQRISEHEGALQAANPLPRLRTPTNPLARRGVRWANTVTIFHPSAGEPTVIQRLEELGYHSVMQVFVYRDGEGNYWLSQPQHRYGRLTPLTADNYTVAAGVFYI